MLRLTVGLAGLILVATSAAASTYTATAVVQPAATRINASDIAWTCGEGSCRGSTQESRPLVLCQDLARHVGRLTAFVADGQAFGAYELGRCNAKAVGAAPVARAN